MPYLFYEDWNDNKYSRDTAAIIALGGKLNNAGGRLIPKTTWVLGSGTATITNGVNRLAPAATLRSARAFPFNPNKTLVWEYKGRSTYSGRDHALRVTVLGATRNNRWTAFGPNWQEAGNLNALWKCVNGSWTIVKLVAHSGNTNWHTISGKRYPDGTWEIFYDGVSDGTVADSWLPSGNNYIWVSNDAGTYIHDVEFDNFK
ncbi:hypothetical protein DRO97_06310, partial [Archaeoglobales archaeon]